jgi:hypothetical protein
MPSAALSKFERKMLTDVERIIQTHADITDGTPGNKGLGHLTRAGVLLLCAAWELYIEEVLIESVEKIIERASSPDDLPPSVKLRISNYIRSSKHNLKPLEMAGDGWQIIYIEIAREWVVGLNTPKKHNIDQGFLSLVGISNMSNSWTLGADAVNAFVAKRGEVAHRGADADNIRINVLCDTYTPNISQCVVEMDNAISNHIRALFPGSPYPWNRRNII